MTPDAKPHVFGWCFSWGRPDQHHDRCPGAYKRQDGSTAVCECPAHKENQ